MKNAADRRISTTRRRFLLGAPFGVPAFSAYILGGANLAKAAPSDHRNLLELTATEAVSLLRSGDLSSEQYTQALLEQCRKYRALNAFNWQDEAQVLEAARAADKARRKKRPGPLHGLPILLKANIGTSSAPTSAGTPALRDHRSTVDAAVVIFLPGPSVPRAGTWERRKPASISSWRSTAGSTSSTVLGRFERRDYRRSLEGDGFTR